MNTALWVIWFALLVVEGSIWLTALRITSRRAWRNGYEQGCDDEAESCAPVDPYDDGRPAPPWSPPAAPLTAADSMLPWSDTVEHLMQIGAPYYEPLARGAGPDPWPVTTAPCPSADIPLKGDSPGPGLPPSFLDVEPPFLPRGESPIFDRLATETSAPIGSPPVGAEPEPPAPVTELRVSGDNLAVLPGPSAGAGADPWDAPCAEDAPFCWPHPPEPDPWHQITAPLDDDPELNEWSIRAERARCHEITRELRELGKALSKPFELTPWKGATA